MEGRHAISVGRVDVDALPDQRLHREQRKPGPDEPGEHADDDALRPCQREQIPPANPLIVGGEAAPG